MDERTNDMTKRITGEETSRSRSIIPFGHSTVSENGSIIPLGHSTVSETGSIILPIGSIVSDTGSIILPIGSIMAPDGSITRSACAGLIDPQLKIPDSKLLFDFNAEGVSKGKIPTNLKLLKIVDITQVPGYTQHGDIIPGSQIPVGRPQQNDLSNIWASLSRDWLVVETTITEFFHQNLKFLFCPGQDSEITTLEIQSPASTVSPSSPKSLITHSDGDLTGIETEYIFQKLLITTKTLSLSSLDNLDVVLKSISTYFAECPVVSSSGNLEIGSDQTILAYSESEFEERLNAYFSQEDEKYKQSLLQAEEAFLENERALALEPFNLGYVGEPCSTSGDREFKYLKIKLPISALKERRLVEFVSAITSLGLVGYVKIVFEFGCPKGRVIAACCYSIITASSVTVAGMLSRGD